MENQKPIRVLIVDDHAMLRKGLATFLISYDDLELVGEASNGKEGVVLCAELQPDVVLMDLVMPIMDGISATRLIHQDFPNIKVIALTSFGGEHLIKHVLEAGVVSYLLKKVSEDGLAEAIRAAHQGISTFSLEVKEILVHSVLHPNLQFESLTPREAEVLSLMVKGLANAEIAQVLMVSISTIKSHVSNILSKLGVASRVEAIVLAMEHAEEELLRRNAAL